MQDRKWVWFMLFCCIPAFSQDVEFSIGTKKIKTLSLAELKKISKEKDLTLKYHFSKARIKRYRALDMKAILRSVYGAHLQKGEYTELVTLAHDGYNTHSDLALFLKTGGAYLAFKDLDVKSGWEPVDRADVSPAPYFLVWENPEHTVANRHPWVWALKGFSLLKFEELYKKVSPRGVKKSSDIYKGYEIFRGHCFNCHAINDEGGKLGPDLAAPQNITVYRSESFLRAFIKNPTRFRYTKMPSHDFLSDKEVGYLISYLRSRRGKSIGLE